MSMLNAIRRGNVLNSKAVVLTGFAMLSSAAIAQEQSAPTESPAMMATSICEQLHADFDGTSAKLSSEGWTKPDSAEGNKFWDEPSALTLSKDGNILFFIGKDTSLGAKRDDFGGTCQMAMPGNSIVAATQIAAYLDQPASGYAATGRDIFNSISFRRGDTIYEVASLDEQFTSMRIQVGKRVSGE